MEKRLCVVLVLVLALIACGVSAQETKVDSGPVPAPVTQPGTASDAGFTVIQEIPVPTEYMVMPGMKVSGDGKMVLYVVQIAGDQLEYAAMANSTRLTNKLLDVAKSEREKTGNTSISLEPADYRFAMVYDLMVSPLWQGVAYGAMTLRAGPVVLVNRLDPPNYTPVHAVSGVYPSWFFSGDEKVAFWARMDNKIKLMADEQIDIPEGALPVSPAVIREKTRAYVLSIGSRLSLFLNGKKICEDYDFIEPTLYPRAKAGEYGLAYIARKGEKSILVIDGKEQETKFTPGHDPVVASRGEVFAYAAVGGGREFAVRNSERVTKDKDFAKVRMLTFDNETKTKLAYVAQDGKREWVMMNDRKVTPDYDLVTFCQEQFRINGILTFAGLDAAKNKITVGNVTDSAKANAPAQK